MIGRPELSEIPLQHSDSSLVGTCASDSENLWRSACRFRVGGTTETERLCCGWDRCQVRLNLHRLLLATCVAGDEGAAESLLALGTFPDWCESVAASVCCRDAEGCGDGSRASLLAVLLCGGVTPWPAMLEEAHQRGNWSCVEVLLQAGAQSRLASLPGMPAVPPGDDSRADGGLTETRQSELEGDLDGAALWGAASMRFVDANFGRLLCEGASPNWANRDGRTPFHELCLCPNVRLENVEMALQAGADAGRGNVFGNNVLLEACWGGSDEIVSLLLLCFPSLVNSFNQRKASPLHLATLRRFPAVLEVLLRCPGIHVDAADDDGKTAVHLAVEERPLEYCVQPTRSRSFDEMTLHGMTQRLLFQGADVDPVDALGETPTAKAVRCNNIDAVELLVGSGADVGVKVNYFGTLLHMACGSGSPLAHLFLAICPEFAVLRNYRRHTALGCVATSLHGFTPMQLTAVPDTVLSFLTQNFDDVGETVPLIFSACSGRCLELAEVALSYGQNPNVRLSSGITPLLSTDASPVVELLLLCGAHVDASPLFTSSCCVETMILLLESAGPTLVNSVNDRGETPLHSAAASVGDSVETIKLLVANGADPNRATPTGYRPLHAACRQGRLRNIQALIEMGAVPDTVGTNRRRDVKRLMVQSGAVRCPVEPWESPGDANKEVGAPSLRLITNETETLSLYQIW